MAVVKQAWIEDDSKLCVRLAPDTGAETLGIFHPRDHAIVAEDFIGKSLIEACTLFNDIVYPKYGGE